MCAILQAVERTGSIKHAATELGKSYRHIWGRIKAAESVVGRKLVETHIGGKDTQRSLLTPDAQEFIAQFLAMGERVAQVLGQEFG
jgi:molybdate transport system regulatory protein